MKRILFVDDEPRVLDEIQSLLRKFRKEWEMVFACGGEAAIEHLEKARFDVIVADMRMPGMDGATLLKLVQDRYPATVRIVLFGQSEEEVARRVVFVAHQFLAKPCDPAQLKEAIERACTLNALLKGDELQKIVGRIGQLPAVPSVYTELVRILQDPNASLKDAARVVQKDPAISAKTLQVVNSAFFGLPRRMADVEQAVCYLGVDVLKGLALLIEVFHGRPSVPGVAGFDLQAEQAHALFTARIARRLLPDTAAAQNAFTAGMLHDCGKLIVATRLPETFSAITEEALRSQRPDHVVEDEVLGVSHAAIGAYLLGLWGLPFTIVEAVAHHHVPSQVEQSRFDVLGAVHVADRLAHEALEQHGVGEGGSHARIDTWYLDTLGVSASLPAWRRAALEERAALEQA